MVAIALVLIATSYLTMFALPRHMVSSKVEIIERRAESLVFVLSSALKDAQMDPTSVENTISAAKMIDDLAYLLITDEEGQVLSAVNEAGARRIAMIVWRSIRQERVRPGLSKHRFRSTTMTHLKAPYTSESRHPVYRKGSGSTNNISRSWASFYF